MQTAIKNKTLSDLAKLISTHKSEIIRQNKMDLAGTDELDPTLADRLKVDEKKVDAMVASINEVIHLEDPEGQVLHHYDHPNGMNVENRSVPFGRILIIYESRPDVTIEAAINAFKAGNKIYLKGGKESKNTNVFLVNLWAQALQMNNLSSDIVTYLDIDRHETQKLLKGNHLRLDLIIPRGGEALINYIKQNTSVPLIISGRGNNFVYVHSDADFTMAQDIIINGKSRLSVCNAIDKVLFNANTENLKQKVEMVLAKALEMKLDVYGDGDFFSSFMSIKPMKDQLMYEQEFLSPKILFGIVDTADNAILTINKYSGGHSAVIVTENKSVAEKFQNEVDCAAVYHNASSRFTDGGQFGFGAEIAISTQKLHFRGPVGLAQLVTNKWFITGNGQIRN
ncbi:MAG: glutamate-5-semialdehyde dehydrogenase [Bacteroidales bacterium]|nr:glutamate-5-semialdehyde dehydrogenase [Bacteroidales bacterium]